MHVNPRPAHAQPYRSSLYLPGSLGRYRQYPNKTRARIPGVGYKVGKGIWGPQVLYLGGYGEQIQPPPIRYPYGNYSRVPLLGLGQVVTTPWYGRTWVWMAGAGAALLFGVGSFYALKRNGRRRRRSRR